MTGVGLIDETPHLDAYDLADADLFNPGGMCFRTIAWTGPNAEGGVVLAAFDLRSSPGQMVLKTTAPP